MQTLRFVLFIHLTFVGFSAFALDSCHALFSEPIRASYAFSQIQKSADSIDFKAFGIERNELTEVLRKDPKFNWVTEEIMSERVGFATNRSERSREGIAKKGFLNMFQAKRSTTEVSPEGREKLEAAVAGMSLKDYQKNVPIEERPIYGYLAPEIGSHLVREKVVQGYGTDIYFFKKNRLKDQTSWTIGDSLFRDLRTDFESQYIEVPKLARFIPWKDRDLLLPRLARADQSHIELALPNFASNFTLPNGKNISYGIRVEVSYIELQFWRAKDQRITLDDVESFIFTENPPADQFLHELRKRGIKIYQFIDGQDVLWTEDRGKW